MNLKSHRLFNRLRKAFRLSVNLLKVIVQQPYVINASLTIGYDGKLIKSNWGDDINLLFFQDVVPHPILMYGEVPLHKLFKMTNYVPIGSIIGMCTNENSVIWGAGILKSDTPRIKRPATVLAVRGPRTRARLLEWGIECPEVYGDPAMLVSKYYNPRRQIRHKIGIIPQYGKEKGDKVRNILGKYKEAYFIDIRNYETWQSFIDEILSCEMVASYSLHGLIMAETYGIPSLWIRLAEDNDTDNFKYWDFYESIGKYSMNPMRIDTNTTLASVISKTKEWTPGHIDLNPLLASCPFPLRKSLKGPKQYR